MTLRIGVIGTGVMGAEHARLLDREVSGCVVAGLFDIDPVRLGEVQAQRPAARAFANPVELIDDDQIDAVVIASSDLTHESLVLAAIAAGKPVLCEKPLAPEVAGCERIIAAELAFGRRLVSVGFMRRFDPGYRQLRDTMLSGQLGEPLLMHCVHRNRQAPAGQPTATLISGSAVHEFDIARWLLGSELSNISVFRPRTSRNPAASDDPLLLVLESASGVLLDIEVFANSSYGYEIRCEVVAGAGTVSLDSPAPTVQRRTGGVFRPVDEDWRGRFVQAYRQQLQEWVDAVAAGQPPTAASSWDGYAATVVAEAGIRALTGGTGQRIELAQCPALYAAGLAMPVGQQ